jgi:hypothetical protein
MDLSSWVAVVGLLMCDLIMTMMMRTGCFIILPLRNLLLRKKWYYYYIGGHAKLGRGQRRDGSLSFCFCPQGFGMRREPLLSLNVKKRLVVGLHTIG